MALQGGYDRQSGPVQAAKQPFGAVQKSSPRLFCPPKARQRAVYLGNTGPVAFAALGVHTGAMLVTIGAASVAVYEWVGVDFLRRGWINLDLLWSITLALSGVILLLS